jgi:hypothetical protein
MILDHTLDSYDESHVWIRSSMVANNKLVVVIGVVVFFGYLFLREG